MKPENKQDPKELNEALECLRKIVMDGLCHGFFNVTVSCEVVHSHKRQLIIAAGKSYKFIIPEESLNN